MSEKNFPPEILEKISAYRQAFGLPPPAEGADTPPPRRKENLSTPEAKRRKAARQRRWVASHRDAWNAYQREWRQRRMIQRKEEEGKELGG